jgi:hypothetical protein
MLQLFGAGRGFLLPAAALFVGLVLAGPAFASAVARAPSSQRPVPATGGTENQGPPDSPARIPSRVWWLVCLSVAYYLCYSPLEPALPALVRDQMHGGALAYGCLWSAFGFGAVAALAVAPRLSRYRPGLVNGGGALLWGIVTFPLALLDHAGRLRP